MRVFFEYRTECLSCPECHLEWHSARMRKPVTRHFADVERLFCREQVSGLGDFADQVGGKAAAGVGALARLLPRRARAAARTKQSAVVTVTGAHNVRVPWRAHCCQAGVCTRLSYRGRVHPRMR